MLLSFMIIVGTILLAIAVIYNRLIRDRNRSDSAWSDIDVQLQRRYDLIPQLVAAVDQYAGYERATLLAVSELRSRAMTVTDVAERGEVEGKLIDELTRLVALAEQYPDLQANENFLQLQRDLVETENYLQFARRFYNGAVRQLNTRIETVPNNLVAQLAGFSQRGYFQKSSDDVAVVPLVDLGNVE